MSSAIKIEVASLYLSLKTNFKQASSVRNTGESVWVTVTRGNISGYGEGCPRPYVTQESVDSCIAWLTPQIPALERECINLTSLRNRANSEKSGIDKNPAAWCAIETALLDLFAKEQRISVEELIGLKSPLALYQYTAILGDSDQSSYEKLIARYLKWGFSDFKIKLSGVIQRDKSKLNTLSQLCKNAGVKNMRIRLDANNLWSDNTPAAIDHLSQLKIPFMGIEEPVAPKNSKALSEISLSLNTSVILDESLCNDDDLKAYDNLAGDFIANIKVSRVGGVLRSLDLIKELKRLNWKIIIGAHVGETSVMTRAGMCVAQAAGENLVGHEGGFGMILLKSEPVEPSLIFGAKGQLDLRNPYTLKNETGSKVFPTQTWSRGWGLKLLNNESTS